MSVVVALMCVAALLAIALFGMSRKAWATAVVYRVCAFVCAVALIDVAASFGTTQTVTLPIGLPWLGMHFRIDALSAVFLVVVNLGGLAASIFALGYGRHEPRPSAFSRSSRRSSRR